MFLTNDETIQSIKNSLELSKNLDVASIIIGDKHSGKKTFVRYFFNDYNFIDTNLDNLNNLISKYEKIVIYNFEVIKNPKKNKFF